MEQNKITRKMAEAEVVLDRFIKEKGYPPTYRELCDLLGLKSKNSVYFRLRHCRHKMKQVI